MKPLKLPLIETKKEAGDAKTFKFAVEDFYYKPGQYIIMTLDLDVKDERGNTRAFSIASSPTEKGFIFISTRISQSAFKQKLNSLEIGTKVKISGPMGNFVLDESRNAVMLSGGIGITPLRSMLKYATDKRLGTKIILLYSNRTPEGIIYYNELEEMQRINKNLKIIHTITNLEDSKMEWKGRTGRIDENLVREFMVEDAIFYVCGPPAMVEAMVNLLNSMGIDENNTKIEEFVGY